MINTKFGTITLAVVLALPVWGQENAQNPDRNLRDSGPTSDIQTEPLPNTPVFRVNVVQRSTEAVDYRDRGGSTEIDMRGTNLMPKVEGKAKVSGHTGRLAIDLELKHFEPAHHLGPQYLTYVVWGITPEGRAQNLGEVIPKDNGEADLQITTALQSFGLIVTAEPYFAVTRPGDYVVAENIIKPEVKGFIHPIDAKFDLMQRDQAVASLRPDQLPATGADFKKMPLQLLEAQNAIAIAEATGAREYAADTLQKAKDDLDRANDYYNRKQGQTPIGTVARAATQAAEDARLLTIDKKEKQREADRRAAMQRRVENAKLEAEASSQRAQQEADQRARADAENEAAQRARADAEQARAAAQQELQQAQLARQQAESLQQQSANEAAQARAHAQDVEQQAQQQRARLLSQLNQVLQTRDTAQGIVANVSDVLFDVNKATLKPDAKIPLAKVAGIILAYPDLKVQINGYTDSTGSLEHNQVLSEQRAAAVRDFMIAQGVGADNVNARGFGPSEPVASNATTQGRQLNRRVEMVVNGAAIGQTASAETSAGQTGTSGSIGAPATSFDSTRR